MRRSTFWGRLAIAITVLAWWQLTVNYAQDVGLTFRVQAIEGMNIERRLTAMETRLDSIETIGEGVIVVVLAQLILGGLAMRKVGK